VIFNKKGRIFLKIRLL